MMKIDATKRYIPVLIIVSLFIILSNYISTQMISSNKIYTKILIISSKQRVLSQQLILYGANYNSTHSSKDKLVLEDKIQEMKNEYKYLKTKIYTPKLQSLYNQLDIDLKAYLDNFYKLLQTNDVKYRIQARKQSFKILKELDLVVDEYEKYAHSKLEQLEQYGIYLMLATLFIIVLSVVFVFIPASKIIDKQTSRLKDKEEYEETVIESNNTAIIAIDWTGKITTYNKKAQEIFGWTKDEMIGTRNLLNIIPPKYKELHTKASTNYLTTGKSCGVIGKIHELEGIRKDGEIFPITISFGSKYKPKGAIVVANIEDITKQKEQELLLIQQSKMASMGEMIGNIAHQWRQPLSAITTHASGSLLYKEMEVLTDEQMIKSFNEIIKNANFLSETIDDFRNFFEESKHKEPFSIIQEVEHIKGIIKNSYINNNIEIVQTQPDEDVICNGIKNEFGQVLINILNNAKDVLVERDIKNRFVKICIESTKTNCCVKIYDNAGGIPKDILPKIFEPYFTTKHQTQGTGIGLHMSSEIIFKHFKGTLVAINEQFSIADEDYYGACFIIDIPLNS